MEKALIFNRTYEDDYYFDRYVKMKRLLKKHKKSGHIILVFGNCNTDEWEEINYSDFERYCNFYENKYMIRKGWERVL